eukprot:GHVS01063180.1.p1 GENE.GHVS01063180.1~~GHVS01063180.1.p1  ORF type:complete len:396 (+),score=45.98 GHVS01063180.1:135-1322(+)
MKGQERGRQCPEVGRGTRQRGRGGRGGGGRGCRARKLSVLGSNGPRYKNVARTSGPLSRVLHSPSRCTEFQFTSDHPWKNLKDPSMFFSPNKQEKDFRPFQSTISHQYVESNRPCGVCSSPSGSSSSSSRSSSSCLIKGRKYPSTVPSSPPRDCFPSEALLTRRKISPSSDYHIPPSLRLTPPNKRTPTYRLPSPCSSSASSSGSSSASCSSSPLRRASSSPRLSRLLPSTLFERFRVLSDRWVSFLTGTTHSYYKEAESGHTFVADPKRRTQQLSGDEREMVNGEERSDGSLHEIEEAGKGSGGTWTTEVPNRRNSVVEESPVGLIQPDRLYDDAAVSVIGNTVVGRNAVYRDVCLSEEVSNRRDRYAPGQGLDTGGNKQLHLLYACDSRRHIA